MGQTRRRVYGDGSAQGIVSRGFHRLTSGPVDMALLCLHEGEGHMYGEGAGSRSSSDALWSRALRLAHDALRLRADVTALPPWRAGVQGVGSSGTSEMRT